MYKKENWVAGQRMDRTANNGQYVLIPVNNKKPRLDGRGDWWWEINDA